MYPLTDEQVEQFFGDPRSFMKDDGTVDKGWELKIVDYCPLPARLPLAWDTRLSASKFKCHRLLVPAFQAVFEELYNDPAAWKSINDFGGCYQWRTQRNAKVLSRHSWGIAVDVDVRDNPMGATTPMVNPDTIAIFAKHGFVWGGYFHGPRVDPMHFEFADLAKLAK